MNADPTQTPGAAAAGPVGRDRGRSSARPAADRRRTGSAWINILHFSRQMQVLSMSWLALVLIMLASQPAAKAQTSGGRPGDLLIAAAGTTQASIVVREGAGQWERQAATDLRKYIALLSGAVPRITNTFPSGEAPVIIIGDAALQAEPSLRTALAGAAKQHPLIRADAIAVRRAGQRLYLAGTNDDSHYFAVVWLLNRWGCRWYLPTDFGEVVPHKPVLTIGSVDIAYGSPFEIRHYWLSWNGDTTGASEFRRRNFMTETSMVGMGHALGAYTQDIAPTGQNAFAVPFSDPKTAEHVAAKIERDYAAGRDVSLAIEDGIYASDSADDRALIVEYDRYTLQPSLTDAMLTFYNRVGAILRHKYPESRAKIGGMAYANVTLPPQKVTHIEPNVALWLAPIDIDPNHSMDDPGSQSRQAYKAMVYKWAELLGGRLAIYDYDQGMLIWRDLPNPSHHVFAVDIRHYARAGILGVGTESRGAAATTFLNLFFRGQLMWNPNVDLDALLAEFYQNFYGPAAEPASRYWNAIFRAWKSTPVTEHEYIAAPAIYTPELVAELQRSLSEANAALEPLRARSDLSRNEALYLERFRFTQLSFDIIRNYVGMVTAGARDSRYREAVSFGEKALEAREALTTMDPTFTTYKRIGEVGPAWFPGEVDQMRDLAARTEGPQGSLVKSLPLLWAFRKDASLPTEWKYGGPEGGRPDDGGVITITLDETHGWKAARTDLYLQAQGFAGASGSDGMGHYWYRTELDLKPEDSDGELHLMFPGLLNESWLYINGALVAGREGYLEPWWRNDYRFEWDVDVSGRLKAGRNDIAVRGFNPHHWAGIFRRPFLYRSNR